MTAQHAFPTSVPGPAAPSSPARPREPSRTVAALATTLLLATTACGPVTDESRQEKLTVFAAASLTGAFSDLERRFEDERPGVDVELNFAGSSDLAAQIEQGAPADVFASADTHTMDLVTQSGRAAGDPQIFARNTLQIAVPPDNPAGVDELADLAREGTTVALCAENVPCGAASQTVMAKAELDVAPASWERDVKAALTKVELGEVDAALVYRTDVIAAGDQVKGIDVPEATTAVNDYPIVVLSDTARPELAQAWLDTVTSPAGSELLTDAGFQTP
ncbi:molybdate ABC transporter substrate-binding protein [Salinactinospora qingdaonensis]|uniref:Molybdate ABC transporter substrate-binding protein n=1 Tax=Salinactinospora qingdaonensis TaxID=702744 RepID=A0ABP7G1Q5_9ACTN